MRIKEVTAKLKEMDDEHGVFWVSVIEAILEVDKTIEMIPYSGDVENSVIKIKHLGGFFISLRTIVKGRL